jgi:hypothetical protein
MREFIWWLTTYVLMSLASPVLGHLQSQWYAPDVALLTALYAGGRTTLLRSAALAFALGLCRDGFAASTPVGLYTEVLVLVALSGRLLATRVDLRSPVPLMATAAGVSVAATLLFLAFEATFHRSFDAYGDVLRMAMPLALVTMLVAPAQFALLQALTRRFEPRDRSDSHYLSR